MCKQQLAPIWLPRPLFIGLLRILWTSGTLIPMEYPARAGDSDWSEMIGLFLAIAAWGIVHSWLASLEVKQAARRMAGEQGARPYRLIYNIFSVVTIAPILVIIALQPGRLVYAVGSPWLYLMLAGQLAALVCLALAVLQTDALSFIGLRQLFQAPVAPTLQTHGFYRLVRHPLYLFGLIILWLTPRMTLSLMVAYLAFSAYFLIGALFEERKLLREFGDEYSAYRKRTPMFLPLPWRAGKLEN